jgi:threonine synthase
LPQARRQQGRWVLVATAHPAKFREIVEPLIGRRVAVPDSLARLLELPAQAVDIAADLDALRQGMNQISN